MLLGIDVGGTSVKYATCDEKGHLFDKGSFKTPDTLLPVIGENVPDLLAEFHGAQLGRLRITPFFDLLPEGQSVASDHSASCSFPGSSGSRTYFRKTPVIK